MMNLTSALVRALFLILCLIFMLAFTIGHQSEPTAWSYILGAGGGIFLGFSLLVSDFALRRFNLRNFNLAAIGLFFGYLMALALTLVFDAILEIAGIHTQFITDLTKIFIFLFATYLGVMMALRASDEIYLSIPFVKFSPASQGIKTMILDFSALQDPRLIDLAATGLLDQRLILPRFLIQELQQLEEKGEVLMAGRAKKTLEMVKRLETLAELRLRYQETDFPDVKEITMKVIRLARLLNADILSAESRIQTPHCENIKIINIHTLSNILKPLMKKGEPLKIKIQRPGKDETQGVGYLDDGSMVVINGGVEHIGRTVEARVLSVSRTASGRIIFCNMMETEKTQYEETDFS
jgi:uncharacterized protein YacL